MYTPTTWQTGDTITATALNKMEQGIANAGVLVCGFTEDLQEQKIVLDKTGQEIVDALSNGKVIALVADALEIAQELIVYHCNTVIIQQNTYLFPFVTINAEFGAFSASSLSEYPKMSF